MLGICKECGCTDNNACVTEGHSCYWVNSNHDLCSACVSEDERGERVYLDGE